MRAFPIFVGLFFCACTPTPDKSEKSPDGAARVGKQSPAPRTSSQADSTPAPSAGPAGSGDGGQGVAELQRLAATQQKIFVNTLDLDSVGAGEFVPDEASTPSAYEGQYHFGDSEWESTLTLSVQGNTVSGILGYAEWEHETWVGKEVRFDGGRIAGASLLAPGWKGVFVRFQGRPGLVILQGPTDELGGNYGEKQD